MALECECFFVEDPRVMNIQSAVLKSSTPKKHQQVPQKAKTEIDICEILKRTEDVSSRHNDYECHVKGEERQNLINKLKMFLDDYDDRPVMKRKKDEDLKAKGQTGFGPLIKYPGYVDYDHPYFSDPYDKMPQLAATVGYKRGENPCPPISVRNWDDSYGAEKKLTKSRSHWGGARDPSHSGRGCHCAKRTGKSAKCMAAPECQNQGGRQGPWTPGHQGAPLRSLPGQASTPALVCLCRPKGAQQTTPPTGGIKYHCYPLPNN